MVTAIKQYFAVWLLFSNWEAIFTGSSKNEKSKNQWNLIKLHKPSKLPLSQQTGQFLFFELENMVFVTAGFADSHSGLKKREVQINNLI